MKLHVRIASVSFSEQEWAEVTSYIVCGILRLMYCPLVGSRVHYTALLRRD